METEKQTISTFNFYTQQNFLPGFSAVITHSQLSVIHLRLWPISNIPDDDVTIFEPQDW